MPTPATKGRKRWWEPLKYSVSRPPLRSFFRNEFNAPLPACALSDFPNSLLRIICEFCSRLQLGPHRLPDIKACYQLIMYSTSNTPAIAGYVTLLKLIDINLFNRHRR